MIFTCNVADFMIDYELKGFAMSEKFLETSVSELSADEIVKRLRNHVNERGGPTLNNGTWELMLRAADLIEELIDKAKSKDDAYEIMS
jgi:hypothetical protein